MMWTMLILVLLVVLISIPIACWLYYSWANFVDGDEQAIKVMFGKVCPRVYKGGDGWIFIPLLPKSFRCYLKRYSMTRYDLDYDTIKVISKEGMYDSKPYKPVEMSVESRAYISFPREREMLVDKDTGETIGFIGDLTQIERNALSTSPIGELLWREHTVMLEKNHPLIEIFRSGMPTEQKELQNRSEEAMQSSVRDAGAGMTWKQAVENAAGGFKDAVEKLFLKADGALIQAGFRPSGIKLTIKSIDVPKELKDALTGEESASRVAKRESIEVGNALFQMIEQWLDSEFPKDAAGIRPRIPKERRREIEKECLNQLTRDRTMKGGGKLVDTRVSNSDGSPFAQGSLSEFIGGIVATVAASTASRDAGGPRSGKGGDETENTGTMNAEELEAWAKKRKKR